MTLKQKPILATYKIQSIGLEKVSSIRDLGVWLDTKLTFAEHINFTVSKANRALGAMIRSLQTGRTAGGLKAEPILAAYFGNIRSVLEYACVVWGGAASTHLERLEKIQHKFLMWLASKISPTQPPQSVAYDDLLASFNLLSLKSRRFQYDVLFVHKIVSGYVDSAYLLGNFPLHVPARSTRARVATLYHVPFARVECVRRGLFCRAASAMNKFLSACPRSDPFYQSHYAFRAKVKSYIRSDSFNM